jgi:nucleoside-diphosphate-sugar epimerase
LITGASGFFGNSVLNSFQKRDGDYKIICVYYKDKGKSTDPRVSWVEQDLLDVSKHEKLLQDVQATHFIHLAWHVPPQNFWHSIKNVEWLYASASLFDRFCSIGGKIFMGAGTLAEYDWSYDVFDEEKTPLRPHTLYGQCKKSLFELLQQIRNKQSSETILLWPRIGYFFGEHEPREKFLSRLVVSIKKEEPLAVVSREMARPYAHVRYVGEALVAILLHATCDETFNVSCSKPYSVQEIVTIICEELKKPLSTVSFTHYAAPVSEPTILKISMDKVIKLTDGLLKDTFPEDLRKFVRSFDGKI